MIYFIWSPEDPRGLVKIGFTDGDVGARLAVLQVGSPVLLGLLIAIEGDRDDEKRLHLYFAAERRHGEWFAPSDRLRAFIWDRSYEILPKLVDDLLGDSGKLEATARGAGMPAEFARQRLLAAREDPAVLCPAGVNPESTRVRLEWNEATPLFVGPTQPKASS